MPAPQIVSQRLIALFLALISLTKPDLAPAQDLLHDRVTPHWIDEGPKFWYRIATAKGEHRFFIVDPEAKSRRPAFDHELVAKLLQSKAGALPVQNISLDQNNEVRISTPKGSFRIDVAKKKLIPVEPIKQANGTTVVPLAKPRTANYQGADTSITFQNKTDRTVELFWVNRVDNPKSYGTLPAGAEREQHTFAGHVWLARFVGEKRTLAVFEATPGGGIAVIDGTAPKASQRKPKVPNRRWTAKIESHNLHLTNRDTGETFPLTTRGTQENPFHPPFHWSPDGKKLLVLQTKRAQKRHVTIVESTPEDQLQPIVHSFPYTKPGDEIDHPHPCLFDLETKTEIKLDASLFPNPWALQQFHWSKESNRVFFTYNQRGHQVYRLLSTNTHTGEVSTIIEEAPETFFCYSSKSFCHPLPETDEVIWMSERDGWNHLYLFNATTGDLKNQITLGQWVVRKVDRVDEKARQVWFQAGGIQPGEDPYHIHYCRVDFDGNNFVDLTPGNGTHEVTFSPDGNYLIDRFSRVDLPPVTELRRISDGSLVLPIETAIRTKTEPLPERFVAKGRDGKTPIYGMIHRPAPFDPKKKYPIIEQIYAGPHGAHVPKHFSLRRHPYAELGFVVVRIDGMGTSHRSKTFHDVAWKNLGDAGFPDRIAWIKSAAKTRPWMDLDRVGIYGGSAGGQNAMRALIAHHDFYDVAAADCGCHDNRMDKIWWNEQWMGWPIPEHGGHYSESSNVDQAHRLQGKLLLIVGELDRNVDPASTMQVAAALQKADKDFDLIVVPGAGHGAAGTPYAKRRQKDFFLRHLRP